MKKLIIYLALLFGANIAQAQLAVPTFNCMGLYWSPAGGVLDKDVLVSYRKVGDATWSLGLNMRYNPISGTTLEKGDYRGSVVNLASGTSYEFKLVLDGTNTTTTITKSTWSENFPVGSTTNVAARTTAYDITSGGTSVAYKVYDGQNNTIDVKHAEQYCIKVSQSYVIVRNFVLKGAGYGVGSGGYIGGIIIDDGVHDVVIEGCDISDFGREHPKSIWPNQGYGRDAGVQMFGESIARIIVQRNKIHHPTYTTNCSFPDNNLDRYVHGDGPDGIHMANTQGNHVFRFNEIYGDGLHMFNYCFEGLDNGSYKGGSGADTDFYGNMLSNSWGNNLESEGGNENTRIWNNYMTISSQHIGNAPVSIGPMYIWRNVFDESEWYFGRGGGSVIKMGYADNESWMTGNIYVFNNTVLQNGKGAEDGIGGRRMVKHTILRNNVNQTRTSDRPALSSKTTDVSFDYDLYNGIIPAGSEAHGIKGVPTYVSGVGYNATNKTGNFQLAPNSFGYDEGAIINNFTDGYIGSAPDMGAHENGWPDFKYGVNGTYVLPSENFAQACEQKNIEVNIIPKPNNCKALKGSVIITDSLAIRLQTNNIDALKIADMLRFDFNTFTGLHAFIADSNFVGKPLLYLSINSFSGALGDEGYVLTINNDSIRIAANAQQGLFYGAQSLLQLVSAAQTENSNRVVLNNCLINDYPRYPWRGMHLDVSRHFFSKAFVFKYLDAMAKHKLNVFHWHLTDDQGWRIEIKKYPKLTDIGAWREDREDQEWSNHQYPTTDKSKKLYGGYYTQAEIREVVAYAAQRQILIVPEIDVPGHSGAAICAYPELSCAKDDTNKVARQPITLCAGNENTYKFLEDVFSELCDLFPGPYIHIGGDECNHTPWETCKLCQKLMLDNNIKDVKELQNYLNQRFEAFLTSKHKRLIGWEEIADGNLSPSSMIMSWQGDKAGILAARKRLQVVMAPNTHLYFDNYFDTPDNEDKYQNNPKVGTLQTIYGYNPDPVSLGPADCRSIYGVQGCLWSESLFSEKIAEKVLLPRLCGLSEIAWTMTDNKDYNNFLHRLNTHYNYLDKAHYKYFIEMPGYTGNLKDFKTETKVELVNKFCKGQIYYTIDGSEPDSQSEIYTQPLKFTRSGILKAKVIFEDIESNTRTCKIIKQ